MCPQLKGLCRLFRRRNRHFHDDRTAMRIAARYGLTREYKLARRHRLTPIEALDDWDLLTEEARKEMGGGIRD